MYNYSESIYEIREDWCIDYISNSGQINGMICRTCNLNKAWNSMEISESPDYEPEPMDID